METIITLLVGGVLVNGVINRVKNPYKARDGRRYSHKETPEEYYQRKLRAAQRKRW